MRWKIATLCVCAFAGLQFMHPVTPHLSSKPLTRIDGATPAVMDILNRSCRDCHSMDTKWPWYARVAPLSWFIDKDVKKGRAFLNFSSWEMYPKARRMAYLAAMGSATSQQRMPPKRYLVLHPEAKLSESDRQILKEWSRSEFRRMRTPVTPTSSL
jgi:hypothetical protein